jgi:hypothetical protein
MMLMALAHGMRPERLLALVAPRMAPAATATTRVTDWGSLVLFDMPVGEIGRWLVAGVPQADPWGVPGIDLHNDTAAAELQRYGPAAIQLTSGPVIAVDMSTGAVLRPLNGIIPLVVSSGGEWVASTSPGLVAGITGRTPLRVEAGSTASPDGTIAGVCGRIVGESVPGVTWSGIERELQRRLAPLGPLHRAELARGPALEDDQEARHVRSGGRLDRPLFLPPFTSRRARDGAVSHYLWLREQVLPRLWFRARLLGLWLCAPAFERPALELVASTWFGTDLSGLHGADRP